MAFSTADLTAIERAIALGEQTVQFQDRTVTYRSISDLLEARAVIIAALNGSGRTRYAVANKGFEQ